MEQLILKGEKFDFVFDDVYSFKIWFERQLDWNVSSDIEREYIDSGKDIENIVYYMNLDESKKYDNEEIEQLIEEENEKNKKEIEDKLEQTKKGNNIYEWEKQNIYFREPTGDFVDKVQLKVVEKSIVEKIMHYLNKEGIRYNKSNTTDTIYIDFSDADYNFDDDMPDKKDIRISDHDANLRNSRNNPHLEISVGKIKNAEEFVDDLSYFMKFGDKEEIKKYLVEETIINENITAVENKKNNESPKIRELEELIDSRLSYHLDCDTHPMVCEIIKTQTGHDRVKERVKSLVLNGGITDVDAALTNIEASL